RAKSALAGLRARPHAALVARGTPDALLGVPPGEPGASAGTPKPGSVWGVCGAAPPALAAAPPPASLPPRGAGLDNIAAPSLGDDELGALLAEKSDPARGPPDATPPVVSISDADLDEFLAG